MKIPYFVWLFKSRSFRKLYFSNVSCLIRVFGRQCVRVGVWGRGNMSIEKYFNLNKTAYEVMSCNIWQPYLCILTEAKFDYVCINPLKRSFVGFFNQIISFYVSYIIFLRPLQMNIFLCFSTYVRNKFFCLEWKVFCLFFSLFFVYE